MGVGPFLSGVHYVPPPRLTDDLWELEQRVSKRVMVEPLAERQRQMIAEWDREKDDPEGLSQLIAKWDRMRKLSPYSPEPSCVSLKSDRSDDGWIDFKKIPDESTDETGSTFTDQGCVSMTSDRSKDLPLKFSGTDETGSRSTDQGCVSMKSDRSKDLPLKFKSSQDKTSETSGERGLGSIFQLLKENIFSLVENQLEWFQKVLSTNSPDILGWLCGDIEEAKKILSSRDALLTITLDFMEAMNLGYLANSLQNKVNFITGGAAEDISGTSSQRDQPNRTFLTILAEAFRNRLKKRKD